MTDAAHHHSKRSADVRAEEDLSLSVLRYTYIIRITYSYRGVVSGHREGVTMKNVCQLVSYFRQCRKMRVKNWNYCFPAIVVVVPGVVAMGQGCHCCCTCGLQLDFNMSHCAMNQLHNMPQDTRSLPLSLSECVAIWSIKITTYDNLSTPLERERKRGREWSRGGDTGVENCYLMGGTALAFKHIPSQF